MYFYKILFKAFVRFSLIALCIDTYAQTIPTAPTKIDFAGVSLRLTEAAQQRLQQALNKLYINRALLLSQVETIDQLSPLLDQRLATQHMPLDFRYACPPFTETGYDPLVFWGLNRKQSDQLNMVVNQSVDSRRHVLLATEAVLPLLNQLQEQNHHWIKTLFQFFDPLLTQPAQNNASDWLLGLEAPTVIWTILARKIAIEHEQALLQVSPSFILLAYPESAGKTLAEIASQLRVSIDRLSPYNAWLLANRIPETGSFPVILRLTPGEYLAVKPRLSPKAIRPVITSQLTTSDLGFPIMYRLEPSSEQKTAIFYEINGHRGIQAQLCDNAITLAYYGKRTVSAFLALNDLTEQDLIKPGEVYYLERKDKRAKIPFHVVKQNQTLRDVSAMYGVRLKSLRRYNRLKPEQRVQVGRIIWMQHKRPARYPVEYQLDQSTDKTPSEELTITTDDLSFRTDSTTRDSINTASTDSTLLTTLTGNQLKRSAGKQAAESAIVTKVHIVKPGQTYFSIARLYGITVNQLYSWNKLSASQTLKAGQELVIGDIGPVALTTPKKTTLKSQSGKPAVSTVPVVPPNDYYTVKTGETLYRIATTHAVSIADLMRWNKLRDYTLTVGQRLLIKPKGK